MPTMHRPRRLPGVCTALAGALLLLVWCSSARAQLRQLPPVQVFEPTYGDEFPNQQCAEAAPLTHPETLSQLPLFEAPAVAPPQSDATQLNAPRKLPKGAKPGVLQQVMTTGTYIGRTGDDDFGSTDVELSATFGFPFPTVNSPLLLKPGVNAHFFDAGPTQNLPDVVYDHYLQIRWMRKIGDRWGVDLSVTPGLYTDLENNSSDAFRLTGHAFTSYDWIPEVKVIAGAVYLNTDEYSVIPAAGVIWTPEEDIRWEFIMPRPRYAVRYYAEPDIEKWWYVTGEFGSGEWAIERADGIDDVMTLNDYRLLMGIEHKNLNASGLNGRLEIGYVFGREITYTSGLPDLEGNDSFLVRAGVWY